MKRIVIQIADKVYHELQSEAKLKGTTVHAIASTKVSMYPKRTP